MNISKKSHTEIYDAAMNGPLSVAALAESVILGYFEEHEPCTMLLWDGKTASEAVDEMDEIDSAKLQRVLASCVQHPMSLQQEALKLAVVAELMRIDNAKENTA